jgi:antitoxin MazE
MQVFKWDTGLAVQLPNDVVEALGLNHGDELVVVAVADGRIVMEKIDKRASFLRQMDQFRFPLPKGYRFNRDEANER